MKLTDEQKRMQNGEYGSSRKLAMDILVALGEINGAEKMIPIKSAHCAGLSLKSHGLAGTEWAENLAKSGARTCVPTTMNVIGVDRSRNLSLPKDWTKNQLRIENAYENMGCYGTSSCVPYYLGFLPRFGEHLAWAESSAVVFTNSVLGARDNREGGPSALAAAIAGCTPYYGMHIKENRMGDVLYKINVPLKNLADYGALGAYVGKRVGLRIPVFDGLKNPSTEDLVYLGAALASSGAVALFHAIGITPEAPNIKGVMKTGAYETIEITEKEIQIGYQQLTSATDHKIDYVAIGCPHCSIRQIEEIACLLIDKKVSPDVTLWVHTNVAIKNMAKQLGYVKIIEDAGGIVTQDLCTVLGNPEALGFKTLATNSAKMAFYAPGSNGMDAWYGDVKKCIDAAITGYWKE